MTLKDAIAGRDTGHAAQPPPATGATPTAERERRCGNQPARGCVPRARLEPASGAMRVDVIACLGDDGVERDPAPVVALGDTGRAPNQSGSRGIIRASRRPRPAKREPGAVFDFGDEVGARLELEGAVEEGDRGLVDAGSELVGDARCTGHERAGRSATERLQFGLEWSRARGDAVELVAWFEQAAIGCAEPDLHGVGAVAIGVEREAARRRPGRRRRRWTTREEAHRRMGWRGRSGLPAP